MSGFPVVQVVADKRPDAPVLVDLNAGRSSSWVHHDGFALGEPSDPALPTGGVRDLSVTLNFPNRTGAASRVLARVARAVASASTAYLRFQRDEGEPSTWFRLLSSPSGAVSWERSIIGLSSDALVWPLTLLAEGFGYGELVTRDQVTILNGRAGPAGINHFVLVEDVEGDVPTSPIIRVTPSGSWAGKAAVLACASVPYSMDLAAPVAWAGRSLFPSLPYSPPPEPVPPNPGAAYGRVYLSSAASSVTSVAAPSAPPPGRYRVMVLADGGAAGMRARLGQRFGTDTLWPTEWRAFSGGGLSWRDFGSMTFPAGADPTDLAEDSVAPPQFTMEFNGSYTSWGLYAFMLIPERLPAGSGCTLLGLQYGAVGPASNFAAVVDADARRYLTRSVVDGKTYSARPPLITGGWPRLVPGERNIVTLLQTVGTGGTDNMLDTATLDISYYPRPLHLMGG